MAEKKDQNEREYIIPLRKEWNKVPRYKRANKAIKAIKEFLVRHMKIRDRDLKKIKIDSYLNEEVWFRGIRNPPSKIKVKAIRDGENIKAELSEFKDKLRFKKAREERRGQKATEAAKVKEAEKPKEKTEEESKETRPGEAELEKKEETEKKEEEKEKKAAVIESGQKIEKSLAKKAKHETSGKEKIPKHKIRKTLAK